MTNAEQGIKTLERIPLPNERCLVVAPLYHAAAAALFAGAIAGCNPMIIHDDFDPVAVADALEKEKICSFTLVPAMIQALLVYVPDIEQRNFDSLEIMYYGASPIAEETLRKAIDVFQCRFYQAYGQTEAAPCLTYLTEADHQKALAGNPDLLLSCGRAIAGTEIRIVDEEGNDVAEGEVGEIIARGPQLMEGYWKLPEATAQTLKDGWLYTGDAAIMDAEGYIYIQDRMKDMIITGGENVYPREVENVLFEHPAIADAAVIGVPNEKFGEAIMACVVLREGETVTEDELIEYSRTKLGGYKIPRQVTFMSVCCRVIQAVRY